jgi:hypothetical protein
VASAASAGADAVAERGDQLLSEVVDRLPIRRADGLLQRFGDDPAARASLISTEEEQGMTDEGSLSSVDMRTLFRAEASASERLKALTDFAGAVRVRLHTVASAASAGADAVAEQGGQLLSEVVDRLPIRRADELRQRFGDDPASRASGVIGDAAELTSWLWRVIKTIPIPDESLHPAKVVLHSAIEIRMVGELFEAHRNLDAAPTPLPSVLAAWVNQAPGSIDWSMTSVASILVTQVRRALTTLRSSHGIIRTWRTKGEEGVTIVRDLGERLDIALRRPPSQRQPSSDGE